MCHQHFTCLWSCGRLRLRRRRRRRRESKQGIAWARNCCGLLPYSYRLACAAPIDTGDHYVPISHLLTFLSGGGSIVTCLGLDDNVC